MDLPGKVFDHFDRGAKLRFVESTTGGQHAITDDFRLHSPDAIAGIQRSIRIDRRGLWIKALRGLAIDGRGHQQFMHSLQAPTLSHQFVAEPVEQFGVCRARPKNAELTGGIDNPPAKMLEPDPIGEDSSQQWVLAIYQMPSPGESPSRGGEGVVLFGNFKPGSFSSSDSQITRLDGGRRLPMIASMKHRCDRGGSCRLGQNADKVFNRFFRSFSLNDGGILFQFFCRRVVELVQHTRIDVEARVGGDQFFLFFRPLVIRRFKGGSQGFSLIFGKFFERLVKGFSHQLVLFFVIGRLQFASLGLHFARLGPVGIGVQGDHAVTRDDPVLPVQARFEDRPQPVVIGLRNRVITVVMALGTPDTESQQ